MSTRPRDSQRSKVYEAEGATFGRKRDVGDYPNGKRGMTLVECQAYINKLTASAWFVRRYGTGWDITLIAGRGGGWARGGRRGTMSLGVPSRIEWIILHELAHHITTSQFWDAVPWHGREFCQTYLILVEHAFGTDAARALKQSFDNHGVKWRKKRTMSPEQKEAAAARLATYRNGRSPDVYPVRPGVENLPPRGVEDRADELAYAGSS